MKLNRFIKCFISLATFVFLLSVNLSAQSRIQTSFNTGYHLVNTDQASDNPSVSTTDWSFGGSMASQFTIQSSRFEYSIGYMYGRSTIYEVNYTLGFDPTYTLDLRYRSVPFELFWVYRATSRIELLGGFNVIAQNRTLLYSGVDIEDDRLFSLGVGLSSKVRTILNEFNMGKGGLFFDMSIRWTEFVLHHANGRHMDDFKPRHITLSPQLGIYYNFN